MGLLCRWEHRSLKGPPRWVCSVDARIGHLKGPLAGVLLCRCAHRSLKGAPGCVCSVVRVSGVWWASPCIVQLLMQACGEREAMVMAPRPTRDPAAPPCFHGCPAFPPVSPTHALDPSLHRPQQPSPGIAPQPLSSSSQPLRPPGALPSWLGLVWPRQGLSAFPPLRLPQVRCFALSLKCFSSDSDSCPDVAIRPLLRFPHPRRAGPVLLSPCLPRLLLPAESRLALCGLFHCSAPPAALRRRSARTAV